MIKEYYIFVKYQKDMFGACSPEKAIQFDGYIETFIDPTTAFIMLREHLRCLDIKWEFPTEHLPVFGNCIFVCEDGFFYEVKKLSLRIR